MLPTDLTAGRSMTAQRKAEKALDFDRLFRRPGLSGDAYGPFMPPMIAYQRAGEPGFPFHWDGRALPGTIGYVLGEQFSLVFDESAAPIDDRDQEAG